MIRDYNVDNSKLGRCKSSKPFSHMNICSSIFEEEKKCLERMKNKNEMELMSKIQYELKTEIMKKKAEEKIREQNEKMRRYHKNLLKKKKKKNHLKNKKKKKN